MSKLGNILRDARVEKGYTLNTLQQKTKIQKKYLQAIEEGNFQEMPGHFYIRAFVKQYADIVGLNGDQLLIEHEDEFLEKAIEEETKPLVGEESDIPSRRSRFHQAESSTLDTLLSYLPMVTLIVVILLIIGTLIFAIQSLSTDDKQVSNKPADNNVITVVEPDSVSGETDKKDEPEKDSTPELKDNQIKVGKQVITLVSDPTGETVYEFEGEPSDYEIEVKASNFVWVGIYEDEVMVVDSAVAKGESVKHKPNANVKNFRVRLGYPEGGDIYINGTKVKSQSEYIKETILFKTADSDSNSFELDLPEQNSKELTEVPTENNLESTGYQGPAVYDPNNE